MFNKATIEKKHTFIIAKPQIIAALSRVQDAGILSLSSVNVPGDMQAMDVRVCTKDYITQKAKLLIL